MHSTLSELSEVLLLPNTHFEFFLKVIRVLWFEKHGIVVEHYWQSYKWVGPHLFPVSEIRDVWRVGRSATPNLFLCSKRMKHLANGRSHICSF